MAANLRELESQRSNLFQELSKTGDLRRGSLAENYRCCGKFNCACAAEDHPGHGPQYLLMTKVGGESRSKNIPPGPEVERIKEQLSNHKRFRELVHRIIEINEEICEVRKGGSQEGQQVVKKKLRKSSKKKSPGR